MDSKQDEVQRPDTSEEEAAMTSQRFMDSEIRKRSFTTSSMLALCVSLMATWEALCSTIAAGLVSGGPVSLIYGAIVCYVGSTCSAMSLSELASAQPTAGGQYHFVNRLSPQRFRVFSSWIAGYVSLLGWIAVTGSAPFLAGTQIQGLLVLMYAPDSYTFERWHGTLLYWGVLVFSTIVCIFCSRILPLVQKLAMGLHIVLFFAFIITMCVMAPSKHSPEFVFTEFLNNSGWKSDGLSWCLGLLTSSYVLVGYDGATHCGEEMENPERGIPIAMTGSVLINGLMGFCFLIALLFCMGDINEALSTDTGFPIIQIFYFITGSKTGATVVMSFMTSMTIMATVALQTSAARVLWSFARDGGLPYSKLLAHLDPKRDVPTLSIIVLAVALMLLGLINIGSTTAFNAILSLAVVGLELSYLMPILLLIWRRLYHPGTLVWGPWRLGRAGLFVNVVAALYLSFTCVLLILPPYYPVTAQNMNYAPVVLSGMVILGLIYWIARGRKAYVGPLDDMDTVVGQAVPSGPMRNKG